MLTGIASLEHTWKYKIRNHDSISLIEKYVELQK